MATNPVHYQGPLAAYLEDVGEAESLDDFESASVRRPLVRAQTAPCNGNIRMRPQSQRGASQRTLITANQASSRRSRFQALFETAMSPRLSPRESARFVDKFRYIICTSQLLSDNIVASDVVRKTTSRDGLTSFQFADGQQGQWDSRRAAKHWMGSGGCIILVSILVTWAVRKPGRGLPPTAKASAAVAVSLLVALYLYAQSRRAYSRYLHTRAAAYCQSMVSCCQTFDSTTFKIINLIQDVELLSRGFGIGSVVPPIARMEVNSRQRRCHRLRVALVSALNLSYTANNRACIALEPMTNMRDFNKLSDVYNIILNDEEDDLSILCDDADSIAYLKALFHRLHNRRRKLLCCLLAIQADGRPGNARIWRSVLNQLRSLSDLMHNLSNQLIEALEDDFHTLDPNQIAPPSNSAQIPHEDRHRSQARGINNLSQTLRRTQAKMYILREESNRMHSQPALDPRLKDDLIGHYDSLGSDLHALLAEWQEGRRAISGNPSQEIPESDQIVMSQRPRLQDPIDLASDIETDSVLIRPNSLGFWGPRMSIYNPAMLDTTGFTPLEEALREEIYEGDTIVEARAEPAAQKSRAERIAIMRQERELKQAKSEERRLQQRTRENLQGELKDVLVQRGRRPLGLRLSVHNMRYPVHDIEVRKPIESVMSPPLDNGERKVSTASEQSTGTVDSGIGSTVYNY